jgi:hypothetical protein
VEARETLLKGTTAELGLQNKEELSRRTKESARYSMVREENAPRPGSVFHGVMQYCQVESMRQGAVCIIGRQGWSKRKLVETMEDLDFIIQSWEPVRVFSSR